MPVIGMPGSHYTYLLRFDVAAGQLLIEQIASSAKENTMDRAKFFAAVRSSAVDGRHLSQSQVNGVEAFLLTDGMLVGQIAVEIVEVRSGHELYASAPSWDGSG
jgi:hypothetical protein